MKNLKIRTKLSLIIGFSMICLVLLGVISLEFMNSINQASTQIADISVPAIILAEEMSTNASDYRRCELAHIIATDPSMMESYEKSMDSFSGELQQQFADYMSVTTSEKDVENLKKAQSGWNKYLQFHDSLITASRAGLTEEAMSIAIGDAKTVFDEMANNFAELVDYNKVESEEFSNASGRAYDVALKAITTSLIAIILILFIVSYLVIRMIVNPVHELDKVSIKIAEGNLNEEIHYQSKDELGVLAVNFNKTVSRLRDYVNYINEISDVLNQIAEGNLVFDLTYDYAGEFAKIKDALINISDSLNDTMAQINQSSEQVSSGSDQVASGAQALSQGATEQASSVEELAATINEISAQVNKNAENAEEASSQVNETATELENGKRQMKSMTDAMSQINHYSGEIGKIIKTIEDIAFQTNILALNAAVEAARAGAAGKGFAVVADEVRNLASKSADASKSTASLLEATMKAVQEGTTIADATALSLEKIVAMSEKSAELVHEISDASRDQAVSVNQVTQGIDQISSVVQTNSATAQESAAASQELSGQAQVLKNLVSRFQLKNR